MIKTASFFLLISILMACHTHNKPDYYGQSEPTASPEIFAENTISVKGRLEHGISFTSNTEGLTFGVLNKEDFNGVIYYSNKQAGTWSEPIIFEALKDVSAYLPYFAPDGKSLLYAQSQADTTNGFTDIWLLKKKHGSWAEAEKVNGSVNSLSRESNASMTHNNTIYFCSNRGGNGLADIYRALLINGEYQNAERIDAISSVRDEESVFIAADESYLIFSRYATNKNGPDLFISYRDIKGNWMEPTPLDYSINSVNWERRPFVSADNKHLFFTRMSFNQTGLEESDIYWVNTQKVFKPYVFNSPPEQSILRGKETIIQLPADYFKDIDNPLLNISVNQEEFSWIGFDQQTMTLSLNPNQSGTYELIITARDSFSNETKHQLKINVK
jgi:hypothetical protein